MSETTRTRTMTRRRLLTRDLKAICAMAAVPVAAQMIFPDTASAHEHESDGRSGSWGFGGGGDRHHGHEGWEGGEGRHGGRGDIGGRGGNCFLKGTRILTATGERKIEDIAPGDLVPTAFGAARPVQSIGRFRRIRSDKRRPWAKHAQPVRVARFALAPEVPHRDLYVTQGHALLLDGVLIPAGGLINGTTISLYAADEHDELEFFHLKLETHDVIYAEGAPCETLLGADSLTSNLRHTPRKHDAAGARELHCAPIICNGPRSELKVRLRSLMSPWLGPQTFDNVRIGIELRAMSLGAL